MKNYSRIITMFLIVIITLITFVPVICYAGSAIIESDDNTIMLEIEDDDGFTILEVEDRSGEYIGICGYCHTECAYTIGHEWWTKKIHCVRHWCSNCGFDQNMGIISENHLMFDKECYWCGYPVHKKDSDR